MAQKPGICDGGSGAGGTPLEEANDEATQLTLFGGMFLLENNQASKVSSSSRDAAGNIFLQRLSS